MGWDVRGAGVPLDWGWDGVVAWVCPIGMAGVRGAGGSAAQGGDSTAPALGELTLTGLGPELSVGMWTWAFELIYASTRCSWAEL
eukprot:CAMPEP_0173267728 /NCGR_PEP_ID=MMETSP1142-20121109/29937_1 /TAXON_ID=483371 /ORGANISM="non described non described, Strain CCMP2298" /LENGTH=84 /DNA_ID=CAMNT_0014203901 /DNA_START=300 /DNA_END=551 /DNA_ORIENTATION=-